ncbi:ESCRT-II subunit protein VPS36 KNAG_0B06340 [Huiozyma naganishii CBS 8797]|uniref:Vacuolar protein-sorting-associated protein 36 n=1 Tax=Huiozyma naganishii (strain ATCC MYA-139 / BCRC 22969 / CBS 8797 / KCTC 17520 / NBRC 10181 / NCYC 3082 / Yp74L-3) TaxID=1071383 RepID=J7RVU0_HUIN7|nr:hypothetical protein KNAG_0B06340 [Kazachstania naganishii CBS 8797]CCK69062.1 hypothetical protein KNAG_0B06340 [Kazachstania naganishii CBS 8797]
MDLWYDVATNNSGRPLLRGGEQVVLIQDAVGLYDGKERVEGRQSGRVFLTQQRFVYVDDLNPTGNSVALDLENVASLEYSSGFLKRSPRLVVFVRDGGTRPPGEDITSAGFLTQWVCPICAEKNSTEGKFCDGDSSVQPVCFNCGVPADYELARDSIKYIETNKSTDPTDRDTVVCQSCTFINHKLMKFCEMCGGRLPPRKSHRSKKLFLKTGSLKETPQFFQLSFRKSDGSLFAKAAEKTLNDARQKDIFNQNVAEIDGAAVNPTVKEEELVKKLDKMDLMGINGLEKFRENQLLNNDILFTNALQDLNKLMSLANSIERLYKRESNNSGSSTTAHPYLVVDREKFFTKDSFLDEIAREVYEFAMSEFKDNEIDRNVIVTLVDFYAMYNKSVRIGTGLISPQELRDACQRFPKLGLHDLKLLKVNKRVLCLTSVNSLKFVEERVMEIVQGQPGSDSLKITQVLNEQAKTDNSWAIGIIDEILSSCINNGKLVLDEQMSGMLYYSNTFWSL